MRTTDTLGANGFTDDEIEFRTLWVLSTSHITKDNLYGKLGPNHSAGEWPVRSLEEGVVNLWVSEDGEYDDLLDPHLLKIFNQARKFFVRELRFDDHAGSCPLFDRGGSEDGLLNPASPAQLGRGLN